MNCKILAVCDSEVTYADLLTKQLLRTPGNRIEIRKFTDIEKLIHYSKEHTITYALLAESYVKFRDQVDSLSFYFLTSSKQKSEEVASEKYIYRYQSAINIYALISGSSEKKVEIGAENQYTTEKVVKKFIGVFHPVHGNGNTTLAKGIAKFWGNKGSRSLYVNLEEFPGDIWSFIDEDLVRTGDGNLGDLLYYIKQSPDLVAQRLETVVYKGRSYDTLTPIGISQELRHIEWNQWKGFMEILRDSPYDVVIFDIHSCIQGYLDLLENCHHIYSSRIQGRGAKEKEKNFIEEMKLLGKKEILIKMESFIFSQVEDWDLEVQKVLEARLGV